MLDGGRRTEEDNVHTPPIYWGRINGWSVLATVGSIATASILGLVAGTLWFGETNSKLANIVTKPELAAALVPIVSRLDKSEGFQANSAASVDKSLNEVRTLTAPVASTVFRLSQLETSTVELRSKTEADKAAMDDRIDRLVGSMAEKLDKMIEQQSDQNVAVKVLSSQMEDMRKRIDNNNSTSPQKLLWRSGVAHPDRPIDPPDPSLPRRTETVAPVPVPRPAPATSQVAGSTRPDLSR
jgi:chaperonin cofactor prefoldin